MRLTRIKERANGGNMTFTAGFGQSMSKTQASGFLAKHRLNQSNAFTDEHNLKDLCGLSEDELKERLLVAEVVMKKLFQRNKELEDNTVGDIGSNRKGECDKCIEKEERHEAALLDKQSEIEKL